MEFNDLPVEIKAMIFSFLSLKERLLNSAVCKEWLNLAFIGVYKIDFLSPSFKTKSSHSYVFGYYIHQKYILPVKCWKHVSDVVQKCKALKSVSFHKCSFDDREELSNIANCMSRIRSITLINCGLRDCEMQILTAKIESLKKLCIYAPEIHEDYSMAVQNILQRNIYLDQLTVGIELIPTLVPNKDRLQSCFLIDFYVNSLKSKHQIIESNVNSLQRLMLIGVDESTQVEYLQSIKNLKDLRIISDGIMSSTLTFPKLQTFSFRDLQYLQSSDYSIDNLVAFLHRHAYLIAFECWISSDSLLAQLSNVCAYLQVLVLFTNRIKQWITVKHMATLSDFDAGGFTDKMMSNVVRQLKNLRVFYCDHPRIGELTFKEFELKATSNTTITYYVYLKYSEAKSTNNLKIIRNVHKEEFGVLEKIDGIEFFTSDLEDEINVITFQAYFPFDCDYFDIHRFNV